MVKSVLDTATDTMEQSTTTSSSIVSKFVRREIRDLFKKDREAIFNAMEQQYLEGFQSILDKDAYGNVSDATLFALLHNKVGTCYHDGPQFLTAHPAMQVLFEQSLRKASALTLSTDLSSSFYWDFTIEGDTLGTEWHKSVIYRDSWFGPVKTLKEDNWHMASGRFKDAPMKRWKGDAAPWNLDRAMFSSYGILSDPCVPSTSEVLQRSTNFCGIENPQALPPMENVVHCMSTYMNLIDIEACLETTVHANLHSLHGGAWDCAFG